MLPSLIPSRTVFCAVAASAAMLFIPVAKAQVSFFGAPAAAQAPSAPSYDAPSSSGGDGGSQSSGGGSGGAGESIENFFGKSPFAFSFGVREGFDSNPNTSSSADLAEPSWYTNFSAGVSYAFGGPRVQLGANLGGGLTYYYNRSDPVDYNGAFSVSATYLATPRLTLSLSSSIAYLSQPDLNIIGSTNHQNGDYMYTSNTLSAAYQRSDIISTITSYNFTAFLYFDNDLNQNQGNISQTVGQSINWLWRPKTTLVAEYRINTINYYDADLNQVGNYFLLGFDQIFTPKFFWNFRGGAQVNFNQNPVGGSSMYVGPFMESTLRYQFGPNSSLSWNMRYGTEASGIYNVTQRQTFRTGLDLTYGFTPRLSATLGFNYQANYYDQSDVIQSYTENIVGISLGLNYQLTRWASLQAGYQFTYDIAPSYANTDYTRSIAFVGVGFGF